MATVDFNQALDHSILVKWADTAAPATGAAAANIVIPLPCNAITQSARANGALLHRLIAEEPRLSASRTPYGKQRPHWHQKDSQQIMQLARDLLPERQIFAIRWQIDFGQDTEYYRVVFVPQPTIPQSLARWFAHVTNTRDVESSETSAGNNSLLVENFALLHGMACALNGLPCAVAGNPDPLLEARALQQTTRFYIDHGGPPVARQIYEACKTIVALGDGTHRNPALHMFPESAWQKIKQHLFQDIYVYSYTALREGLFAKAEAADNPDKVLNYDGLVHTFFRMQAPERWHEGRTPTELQDFFLFDQALVDIDHGLVRSGETFADPSSGLVRYVKAHIAQTMLAALREVAPEQFAQAAPQRAEKLRGRRLALDAHLQ